jgi:DNA polymerase I-like protein with 3'-5' exonuclease and polymerase domains
MFKIIGASVVYGLALFGLARLIEITRIDVDPTA